MFWRGERDAGAPVHIILHEFYATLGHDIFEASMLAVGAITKIAMDGEHSLRHLLQLVRRKETDHVGEARISLRIAVAPAHAAAHTQVVADQMVVLNDGDEAEAISEDVHV